jgi:hypothetical protein
MYVLLAQSSKEMHMNPDVFGLSNTECLCRNAVLHQGDDVVIMWRTYATSHSDDVECGELTTSDLTQQSGLITHVASDLSQACQKYHCTVLVGIISLQHLPPQIWNQHGHNEKTHKEKK